MSRPSDFIRGAVSGALSNSFLAVAPIIEAPTSPRTRLVNFGQFLRPLTSQLIRATTASQSKDLQQARHEAARAYYKLGELAQREDQLVSSQDLSQLHRLLDDLFHQEIAPHRLEYARLIFRSFLFRIESAQPSTLSLEEMRNLVANDRSIFDVEELAIVRVAHCSKKSCLALLAAQPDLALAYLDFIAVDAVLLADTYPQILSSSTLANLVRTRSKLSNKKIFAGNARSFGQSLRAQISPLLSYADQVCADRARELSQFEAVS